MDTRTQEMDDFIKRLASEKIVNKDNIYGELCDYGLSEEEKKSNGMFIKDQKILSMTCGSIFTLKGILHSFLVFRDCKVESMRRRNEDGEAVKLYIPTNKANLIEVVNKVINYYECTRVMHDTKIARDIRSDDIVTRIYSLEKVDRVVDYLNKELSGQLIKTNPFIMREGEIGIARDGNLSYNERVSKFLGDYLAENIDDVDNLNLNGFREYVKKINEKILSDKKYVEELLSAEDRKHYDDITDVDFIYDNSCVMGLLSISLDDGKGMDDFKKYLDSIYNMSDYSEKKEKINKIISEIENEKKEIKDRIHEKQEIIEKQNNEIEENSKKKEL